jgi:hypothetical protein
MTNYHHASKVRAANSAKVQAMNNCSDFRASVSVLLSSEQAANMSVVDTLAAAQTSVAQALLLFVSATPLLELSLSILPMRVRVLLPRASSGDAASQAR